MLQIFARVLQKPLESLYLILTKVFSLKQSQELKKFALRITIA